MQISCSDPSYLGKLLALFSAASCHEGSPAVKMSLLTVLHTHCLMLHPYPEFPLLSPLHFKMLLMPDLHIHSTHRDGVPLWAAPCVHWGSGDGNAWHPCCEASPESPGNWLWAPTGKGWWVRLTTSMHWHHGDVRQVKSLSWVLQAVAVLKYVLWSRASLT